MQVSVVGTGYGTAVGLLAVAYFDDDVVFSQQGRRIGDVPVCQHNFGLFQCLQVVAEDYFVFFWIYGLYL